MSNEISPAVHVFDIWIDYSEYRDTHAHEYHEFFLTLSGVGEQLTPEGVLKARQGDVFFFPAGTEHNGNGSREGNCLGGVINIHEKYFLADSHGFPESGSVLQALKTHGKRGDYRVTINPAGKKAVQSIFKEMLDETRIKRPGYKSLVNAMTHQFLITLLRHSQLSIHEKQAGREVVVEKINDTVHFLSNHFSEPIGIEQAAQMANMSRSYFHANFKAVTGKTYVEFLNGLRVDNAVRLLRTTRLDTEMVAFRSGFTSLSHFYKVFRERAGGSPGKIRAGAFNNPPSPRRRRDRSVNQ